MKSTLAERLRFVQMKDVNEQRTIERLTACGVDPNEAAEVVIGGGTFQLSTETKEGLLKNGYELPCT